MKKLFSLLLILAPFSLCAAPNITISGNSVTILGSAQTISLTCTLIDPNNTGNLRSGSNIITVFVTSTVTPGNVATCGPIYGNDVILDGFGNPNTTYYKVQVFTVMSGIIASTPALQQFYAFTGSGTVDLSTATPLAPSFFSGPSGNVVMPGTLTVTGATTLSSNLTVSGTLNGIPMVNAANFANVQAALNSLSGAAGIVFVPPGTWAPAAANTPLTITNSFQRVMCAGMDSTVISYTGTTNITAVVDVGTADNGTAQQVNDAVTNCTISGNSHTTYALRVRGTHRSDFSHNKLINAVTAGLFSDFAVADTFDDLHTSSQEQAFTTTPASCFIFDGPDASHQTTATTIKNPICEGVSGTGIQLNHTVQVTLIGGTSEQNNIGIVLSSSAVKDTVVYLDTESNAVANIQNGGFQCTFHDDSGNGLLEVLGTANFTLISGYFYDSIKVDTGAQNTQLDHVGFNNSGAGTLTDSGSGTLQMAVQNLVGAAYSAGTLPAFRIASGTSTMTAGAITAATCQAAITSAATNTAATDSIEWSYATAPTLTTDALLTIAPYVTANNVNFTRCNPTAGSITGTAIVINWRVIR